MKKQLLNIKKQIIFIILIIFIPLSFSFKSINAEEKVERDLNYYITLTRELYTKKGIKALYDFLLFSKPIYTPKLDVNNYNLYSVLEDDKKEIYSKILNFYKTLDKPLNLYQNDKMPDHITFEFKEYVDKNETKEEVQKRLEKYTQTAILLYQDLPNIYFTSSVLINVSYTQLIGTTFNYILGFKNLFSNVDYNDNINYLISYIAKREYLVFEIIDKDTNNDGVITNFERIKNAHDWLYKNNEYNSKALREENKDTFETRMSHRVLSGILDELSPVCEGYAYSFKVLMDRLGIPTIIGTGKGYTSKTDYEAHAWNYVYLENNWYLVDVTWDDPIGASFLTNHHNYFLREALQDHVLYKKGDILDGQRLDYVINEPSPMAKARYDLSLNSYETNTNNNQKDTLYTYLSKKEHENNNSSSNTNDNTNDNGSNNTEENNNQNTENKNKEKTEKDKLFLNKKFNIAGLELDIIHIILFSLVIILLLNYVVLLLFRKKK